MPRVSLENTVSQQKQEFEVTQDEILYFGVERQGTKLPHGCLAGSCSACNIEIVEGKENLSAIDFIEKNTIKAVKKKLAEKHGEAFLEGKEFRLACRARVQGDVSVKTLK